MPRIVEYKKETYSYTLHKSVFYSSYFYLIKQKALQFVICVTKNNELHMNIYAKKCIFTSSIY